MAYVYQDGDQAIGKVTYNADHSMLLTDTYYRLQGSVYNQGGVVTTTMEPTAANQLINTAGAALDVGGIDAGWNMPPDTLGHRSLSAVFLEGLRYQVASGQHTMAEVEALLGDVYIVALQPCDFIGTPSTIPASVGGDKFFAYSEVPALEYMHRTFPTVDDSALMATLPNGNNMPWSIPAGKTALQAALADWQGATPIVYYSAIAAAITIDNTQMVNTIKYGITGATDPGTQTYAVAHTTNAVATPFALDVTQYADAIQKVYIAFFNRPADPSGFNHYDATLKANGGNVNLAAAVFESSPEYQQTYAGMNISQRIDAIYQNLFNRPAEPAGLKYYVDNFNAGNLTLGNIALAICNGAQLSDATTIVNRVEVAKLFTAALNNTTKVSEYSGLPAAFAAKDWMKTVTYDHATVVAATAKMSDVLKMTAASGTLVAGATGDTITLTDVKANSILSFSASDVGKVDKIIHWNADKIDVSGFDFATVAEGVVTITGLTQQVTATTAGFFHGAGVAIAKVGADSFVYVDSDHNGNFNPTTDVTIHVVGATVVAGDVLF